MNILPKPSFLRDIKKLPDTLSSELKLVIRQIENASALRDIQNLKKIKAILQRTG